MPRTGPQSFRFVPPDPRPDALVRPRLLRRLAGRWQHRVTCLVAGAGLGKTTLLAQALAENRLAPRGEDVWMAVDPHDVDVDRFARVVATAVAASGRDRSWHAAHDVPVPEPEVVAEAMWQRSPAEACLVLDDVHLLPAGSSAAAWLGELIAALPANGHIVLSGRAGPPVPLASPPAHPGHPGRTAGPAGTGAGSNGSEPDGPDESGDVLVVGEDELRFDDEELAAFAAHRGLDPARFDETGGWPAMAELVASVGGRVAGAYLWEEVLAPLGPERRHVLAVLCDLTGADDELISAAVGAPVELATALGGVPLVDRTPDGWYVPHGLWRSTPRLALDAEERRALRRRAAEHLTGRERFDEAFRLIKEAELWDVAPTVLRAASIANHQLAQNQLGLWLHDCPEEVRDSAAGCLAAGLHAAFTEPNLAIGPLRQAVARCRAEGDVDAELTAIVQLGIVAAWRQDLDALAPLAERVAELESIGGPRARALAAFSRSVTADVAGDDDGARRELESIEEGALDPAWQVLAAFIHSMLHLDRGEHELVEANIDRLHPRASSAMRYVLDFMRLRSWWTQGRLDDAIAAFPPVVDAARATGVPYHVYLAQSYGCVAYSQVGDVAAARGCLAESEAAAPPPAAGERTAWTAVAIASLRLAEGDEPAATAVLERALQDHGLDVGLDRRAWRHTLPLSYVLLPETRSHWDGMPLRGYLAAARALAAAVVGARAERGGAALGALELPDPGLIRATLHVRFAAELVLALGEARRPEGESVLDLYGPAGRAAVRKLADTQPRHVKPARSLLAAVPAPPRRASYLGVLGPLVLWRDGPDGEEVVDPDLRRKRLQALVGYLVAHRRTTRAAITATLWPDLGERAAGNNLSVTLSRLLRVLEPWRDSGEPSYLVRLDGPSVSLVTGRHLQVDVDDFETSLREAGRAEADGNPGAVLDHLLVAVDLYRGDLHTELPEADWFALDREHYRARFAAAASRAGQLLVGRGDVERAQALARRALGVDPWSEEAYGVLIAAALTNGDRSGARRFLRHCVAALHDLGVQPSPSIQQLHRRIQTAQG